MNYSHKLDESAKYLKVVTRGGSTPKGKRRVYFTCHPKDFDKYFQKVCDDIFKTQDCAIYYTADMSAPIPEQYVESDLGQMNLFVVPITYALLTEKNRAMDFDLAYAMRDDVSIPILPLMMENGIDFFYEKKFGNRQYFSPYSQDLSAIGYEEKLKKYLSSILLDDGTIDRIRKAFDAYIFLSYRKKDRNFANELMKQIHQNPLYRDIAIWYDEFLTPGEDFEENIHKAFDISKLFALLVTPNLVNEKNYVQTTEYPLARKSGKKILPAEWVDTDKKLLKEQYPDIPQCVNGKDQAELDKGIADALKTIALQSNDNDPEHCYLIGLAYLDGIDVEINVPYAIELITSAAEKEYPDAMDKLYRMYLDGDRVKIDYNAAKKWAQKLYEFELKTNGEKHLDTLSIQNNLAYIYCMLGKYKKALELNQNTHAYFCEEFGERDPNTLTSLNNLAATYIKLKDYKKALELFQKAYNLCCEIGSENNKDTLVFLNNLACIYRGLNDCEKSLELNQKVYALCCDELGEWHPKTLISLNNLATSYCEIADYEKTLELDKKAYALRCETLGSKHPDTLDSLNNLANIYCKLGHHKKALELGDKAYILRCEVIGKEHPATLISLCTLSDIYCKLGNYEKALELGEEAYALACEVLGEKHPDALTTINNLACIYGDIGYNEKAIELGDKAYILMREVCGEKHPNTITSLCNLVFTYVDTGDYEKALIFGERAYNLWFEIKGAKHQNTLTALHIIAYIYGKIGDYKKALELDKKVYALRCETLGAKHQDTLAALNDLAFSYIRIGDNNNALACSKKAYNFSYEQFGENHPLTQSALNMLLVLSKVIKID